MTIKQLTIITASDAQHLILSAPSAVGLTPEQVTAIRTHILPLFTDSISAKIHSKVSFGTWNIDVKGYKDKRISEADNQKIWTCRQLAVRIRELLTVLTNKHETPAARVHDLANVYKELEWATKDLDKAFAQFLSLSKRCLSIKGIALATADDLERLLNSPYSKLLSKSWPFIMATLKSEVAKLIKQHGLLKVSKNPNSTAENERFISYAVSKGYTDTALSEEQSKYKYYTEGVHKLSKSVEDGKAEVRMYVIPGDGVKPALSIGDSEYTWARLGVDSGIESYTDSNTVEGFFELMEAKCLRSIKTRLQLDNEGTRVDFGGGKVVTIMPDKLKLIIQDLRDGKPYHISPSGFGTQYSYSIRKGPYSKPASGEISNLVGRPVFYATQDLD